MICPLCKIEMIILELTGVEIDYCITCKGIWLDDGELEIFLNKKRAGDDLLATIQPVENLQEKKKRCPVCRKKMDKISLGSKNKVILDQCNKNHVIWFDSGELNQILKFGGYEENSKIFSLLKDIFGDKSSIP